MGGEVYALFVLHLPKSLESLMKIPNERRLPANVHAVPWPSPTIATAAIIRANAVDRFISYA